MPHSAQSLPSENVTELAALLAKEAVARRVLQKQGDLASGLRDFGTQAAGWGQSAVGTMQDLAGQAGEYAQQGVDWAKEPGQQGWRQGLVGAGVGGLLGLGSSMFRDKEERQPLRSALTGALAGGAIGGGAGLLQQYGPQVFGDEPSALDDRIKAKQKEIDDLGKTLAEGDPHWYDDVVRPSLLPSLGIGAASVGVPRIPAIKNRSAARRLSRGALAADAPTYGAGKQTVEDLGTGKDPAAARKGLAATRRQWSFGPKAAPPGGTGVPDPKPPRRWNAPRSWFPRLTHPAAAMPSELNPHLSGLTNAQVNKLTKYRPPGKFRGALRGIRGARTPVLMSLPLIYNWLTSRGMSAERAQEYALDLLERGKQGG